MSAKVRLKLTIQYDGTEFEGWQIQPKGRTVQGELEKAFLRILGESTSVVGSGRTDSGVHAYGQVAHVDLKPSIEISKLIKGVNAVLSKEIQILSCEKVPLSFHARKSAKKKTYRYVIEESKFPSPLYRRMATFRFCRMDKGALAFERTHFLPLDLRAMERASEFLLGEHDFTSFRASGAKEGSAVRRIYLATWQEHPLPFSLEGRLLIFRIMGNGFLKQMVRNLVGTLIEVGSGKRSQEEFQTLIQLKNRSLAGPTAPPEGLALESVEY